MIEAWWREKAIRDCIAAVEAIAQDGESSTEWDRDYEIDPSGETRCPRIWIREATEAMRSLLAAGK